MKKAKQTMKDTIINLTPPIDEVQYGYNSEEIKEGDWYWDDLVSSWEGVGILCHAGVEYDNGDKPKIIQSTVGTTSPIRVSHKVILSTNPKDLRFPFLQLPSKEQEVDKLEVLAYNKWKENERTIGQADFMKGFIAGFNANKGIYTQEQMEKAIDMARKYRIKQGSFNLSIDFDKSHAEIIQSLQPTAKTVRVEMEEIIIYEDIINVTKWEIKVETSPEFKQRVIKALEVIY